jgi:multiple sugar transport system ATP-binding protein
MDEPLSNLDAKLRTEMRSELKRLHAETDSTFVYVTHDQLEAMTLSTRTCLMKEGIVQQYAPPLEVYNQPANVFVADFVGSPTMNFIEAEASHAGGGEISLKQDGAAGLSFIPLEGEIDLKDGAAVTVGIRPEFIRLGEEGSLKAKIYAALPSGMETIVKIRFGELILTSVVFGAIDYKTDTEINIDFAGDNCILFDKESGLNLGIGKLRVK